MRVLGADLACRDSITSVAIPDIAEYRLPLVFNKTTFAFTVDVPDLPYEQVGTAAAVARHRVRPVCNVSANC